jgi:hypothetical protein
VCLQSRVFRLGVSEKKCYMFDCQQTWFGSIHQLNSKKKWAEYSL